MPAARFLTSLTFELLPMALVEQTPYDATAAGELIRYRVIVRAPNAEERALHHTDGRGGWTAIAPCSGPACVEPGEVSMEGVRRGPGAWMHGLRDRIARRGWRARRPRRSTPEVPRIEGADSASPDGISPDVHPGSVTPS